MDSTEMEALAEKLAEMTRPDVDVDALIATSIGGYVYEKRGRDQKPWFYPEVGGHRRQKRGVYDHLPRYTASLDAAVALVERCLPGFMWEIGSYNDSDGFDPVGVLARVSNYCGGDGPRFEMDRSKGATPAIALCLALLRALQERK